MRTGGQNRAAGRKPVVVLDSSLESDAWKRLFRIGRERDWNLLDLRFSGDVVPKGVRPAAAFVKKLPDDPFVLRLRDAGCHVVRIGDAPHPDDNQLPAVIPDKEASGRLAAEHFRERGFRHVGYVGHKPWGNHKDLYDGLSRRAEELGCKVHLLLWNPKGPVSKEAGYRERQKLFSDWLAGVPKPLGLLGFADWRCALYNRMCADAGVEVPTEVGILGVGNKVDICEPIIPSMSSIIRDYDQIVDAAVDMYERLSAGKAVPNEAVRVPPKGILTRQSTDVLAVADPDIAKALRFMWEHYEQDLALDDVVRASGLSRRTFTGRFRKLLGRSVTEVLREKRLEEACQMLSATDLMVADIAASVGFASIENFHRSFRKAYGTTPRRYRQDRRSA